MRLNEILVETDRLDEKPMGFLKKMGNKALAKMGSNKAAGRLEAGDEANQMKKEFMKFLGTQDKGEGATPDMVLNWLAKNGYPTDGAKEAMKKVTTGAKVGQAAGAAAAGAAKGVGKVAGAVGKGIAAVGKGVADVAKGAVAGAKDATADPKQNPDAQKTPQDNTQANTQTAKEPDPNNAVSIKSAGQKKIVPPSGNKVAVNQSIDFSSVGTLMEGLSSGQLDDVFKAAVADAIARDEGGQAKGSDTSFDGQAAQGGLKGVAQGVATGAMGNATIPPDIQKQIDALNPKQKIELGKML
jgi:hypothetical protein